MYQISYTRRIRNGRKTLVFLTSHYFNNKITEGHKILSDRIINATSRAIDWDILVMSLERTDLGEKTHSMQYREITPRYIDWLSSTIKGFFSLRLLNSADVIHILAYNKIFPALINRITTTRRPKVIAHLYYHPLAFRQPGYLPVKLLSRFQLFDATITASKALKEYITHYLSSSNDSIFYIPPLVPEDLFQFNYVSSREISPQIKKKYGLSENDFVVTYIGHIIPQRGVFELVKAFKEASLCDSSLKLVISHSGMVFKDFSVDYLTLLKKLVVKYGLEGKVIIRGKRDLRELYTLSDILFFGFRESFYYTYPPLVVCEAMAAGVPFILRSSMLIEELFPGATPIPTYSDVDQLVNMLCSLPNSGSSMYIVSKALKEISILYYHPSVVIPKLLQIYYRVLEE
jgi:glycosyltransferase involved in cell wall biosynthesis